MSLSFSRSLRSLQNDSYGLSLVGLAVGILLLVAWSAWFFLAKVTLYETSREFDVRRDGALMVTFEPEALARLQPGQTARLRLANTTGQTAGTLLALVMDTPSGGSGNSQVELYVYSPEPLQPGLTGQVQVEVDYVSPAVLALRSAGQFVDDLPLTLSPQEK